MNENLISWIASRNYRVKDRGVSNAPWIDICVAITAPRKLSKAERPIDSDAANYGCTVQTGAVFTQRVVAGRYGLEALFHGILSIDAFLLTVSKERDVQDKEGKVFDANVNGFLFGTIAPEIDGVRYRLESQALAAHS